MSSTESPGRIEQVDPPWGSIVLTIGVLTSRIGGFAFWILPRVWEAPWDKVRAASGTLLILDDEPTPQIGPIRVLESSSQDA